MKRHSNKCKVKHWKNLIHHQVLRITKQETENDKLLFKMKKDLKRKTILVIGGDEREVFARKSKINFESHNKKTLIVPERNILERNDYYLQRLLNLNYDVLIFTNIKNQDDIKYLEKKTSDLITIKTFHLNLKHKPKKDINYEYFIDIDDGFEENIYDELFMILKQRGYY